MQTKLSEVQTESVDLEIIQLLRKGVIQPCQLEAGEFISPIFTRPKKDGSFRMILNLKSFNTNVTHYHFKMDNIWSAIRLHTSLTHRLMLSMPFTFHGKGTLFMHSPHLVLYNGCCKIFLKRKPLVY